MDFLYVFVRRLCGLFYLCEVSDRSASFVSGSLKWPVAIGIFSGKSATETETSEGNETF